MDLVQHGGGTIGPNDVHKIDRAAVDEALDGEAKSWDGRVVIVHHRVGEGEQHEEVEEPPHAEPGPPCADASASCTPNQTNTMVANAMTM